MAFSYKDYTKSDEVLRKEQEKESHLQNKPGEYTYSDKLTQAYADRDNAYASKPGEFSYVNQSAMDAVMDKIMNREKFSYDVNGDALFQQYKDMYTTQGKLAMMDTMGQASAMTGGYGNSYAQTAGNQAYQSSLQQLGEIVPELYSLAYDKYNQEGQDLYNQYGLYQSDYSTKYGEHRDSVSDWQTNLNYLAGVADSLYNQEYGQHRDSVSDWQNMLSYLASEADTAYNRDYGQYTDNRNLSYQSYQDAISNAQAAESNKLAREKWEYEKEQNTLAAEADNDDKISASKMSTWETKFDKYVISLPGLPEWSSNSKTITSSNKSKMESEISEAINNGELTSAEASYLVSKYNLNPDNLK